MALARGAGVLRALWLEDCDGLDTDTVLCFQAARLDVDVHLASAPSFWCAGGKQQRQQWQQLVCKQEAVRHVLQQGWGSSASGGIRADHDHQ